MKDIPEETKQGLKELAALPPGERYDLLNKLALEGFVITMELRKDEHGILHESINFQTQAEAGYTSALKSVLLEQETQEKKWGEQNHDPFIYLAILNEEVGELAQAALQTYFGGCRGGLDHLREEGIHTAAVALAIVECLDRGKWKWPEVR